MINTVATALCRRVLIRRLSVVTPPLCPACEAPMDELSVSGGTAWVCSQRPECRGRRSARKFYKPVPAAAVLPAAVKAEPQTAPQHEEWDPPAVLGGRARTVCPSTS
jgi:hypothetical protein